MKRAFLALLLALLLIPTFGSAAGDRKSSPKKSSKPAVTSKAKSSKPANKRVTTPEAVYRAEEPALRGPRVKIEKKGPEKESEGEDDWASDNDVVSNPGPIPFGTPVELHMTRAASRRFDLRRLRHTPVERREREERELVPDPATIGERGLTPDVVRPSIAARNAPAPAPLANFVGLDWNTWGSGHPPDTVGDVGPNHYIQSVNSAVGIYQKDGTQIAAFTLDDFMSQGNFGNLCDTDNFGDPVILYDTFEDRWIISDFAFQLDGGGNVINPPGAYQCTAVSMTGDPVSGGWHFYSINTAGGLGDYPKLGVWTDGLYMSVNMFGYPSGAPYQGYRVFAFNKQQMYAGNPNAQVVVFAGSTGDFTLLPSNARLQTGTPPAGTPNYFLSSWNFLNGLSVYKFHVDWDHISLSTFTGPDVPIAATSWPNAGVANVPQLGSANTLDVLQIRAMMQNQYTNIAGVESLWNTHTVRRQNTTGFAAPRWYQVNVTGGTVNPVIPQAATWDPDAANVMHRFMPSLAVDRAGNMALGYSTSNSTTKPAIKYAGRLATDPIETFSQTEQLMFQGAGAQIGTGRWGDYAAMSLDPDGCTFWFTTEYYAVDGHDWQTRVGSFGPFPGCAPVGAGGTLQGTVTATVGGAAISGATVTLGARTTTTNGSGAYSFSNLPAGTYPELSVTAPGYIGETVTDVVITDAGTTVQDFALDAMATNACLVDTTQSDFQTGLGTNVSFTDVAGSVVLAKPSLDQQNTTLSTSGVGINITTWGGQTFTPSVSGTLTAADINLFCSGCTGTTPALTLSVRATAAGLPTGADLATATITGFNSGASAYYTGTFGTPPALSAGTTYALVIRPTANPSAGTYALTRSATNVYVGGQRVNGATSGTVWTAPLTAGQTTDAGFRTYMDSGYITSGQFVSSVKDMNPAIGLTPIWTAISWTATLPAGTSVQFQVAGSNSANGPFNFVGPDGTAATFFTTSGASLSQFYGLRYLQYKAYLATTNAAVTPELQDVSLCYTAVDCSTTSAPAITPGTAYVCPSSTGNTASGPAGATAYSWSITNGSIQGSTTSQSISFTAGAAGNVGLTLAITAANGCHVSNSVNVPVSLPTTPTITPGGPTTFCTGGSVLLTSSSATGNQWYLDGTPIGGATNQTYTATGTGAYTVTFSENGCESAQSSATNVTVNPAPAAPTITPGGPTTFCAGGSVLLTSSSATGNQWSLNGSPIGGATNQTYTATATGNYTVTVTTSGCASAPSSATSVTVNPAPATPTITPGGPTTFCTGGSVLLTSSSATGNQWLLNGSPIGGATNQTYSATATGAYTVVVTASGCESAPSSATNVTVNPTPATPIITPGGPTTFCAGGSVLLTSSSATGNQWSLNGSPIGGATNQTYSATATGNYTVTVTTSGCASAPSSATSVTVNPAPATPTITPGGPTTFCTGGSVLLTSSSASGNQWLLNGSPIGGATNQTYSATATGAYTVVVTASGCDSAPSAATNVTVNPTPATPTITPGGPTTFCAGSSVLLTSSSATGNQWHLNGSPIGGATNQTYSATAGGTYTVVVTTSGCASAPSSGTSVTVNPAPATPTITPGGPTTFCTGGSVLLTSSSATGNQWFLNGNPIGGATNPTHSATVGGAYTVVVTASGCPSAPSSATNVTVNPIPATPTVTPGGPTTFCTGGSVLLTSSSATGNQWHLNGSPIGGATNQTYSATATGNYTVVVTASGCASAPSSGTSVTVNPTPSTPTITPLGPTSFCNGGSVTLSSSSASGNQWRLNGAPIGGATAQTLVVTAAGDYSVVVTASGCASAPSAATTVTVNPNPSATVTAPSSVVTGSTGHVASVPNAGVGATYNWLVGNGTITAGVGTSSITFTAGSTGTLTINVTVTTGAGCSANGNASVTVTSVPVSPVTVTSVTPSTGSSLGGTNVTIAGTGFLAGATVTFGGTAATNVVVVSSTQITARTPAHAAGAVDVTVTNTNATTGTRTNGFTYFLQNFDANGDGMIDPSDIFYLVAYLFTGGPAPAGTAGPVLSGDANGDGVVDPADIFYVVFYLFGGGPAPHATTGIATSSVASPFSGAVTLGQAVNRDGRWFVPVSVTMNPGSSAPQGLSLSVRFNGATTEATINRGAGLDPVFEISRRNGNTLSYLVAFDARNPLVLGHSRSAVVAEVEVSAPGAVRLELDPMLTMLVDGTQKATVANRTLRLDGTAIAPVRPAPRDRTRTNQ
ncbi:MAG TPA: IPT/TIG domain-containing protein [Thermoanaerobaculia bacterium]|jgi:hypothetical protein